MPYFITFLTVNSLGKFFGVNFIRLTIANQTNKVHVIEFVYDSCKLLRSKIIAHTKRLKKILTYDFNPVE